MDAQPETPAAPPVQPAMPPPDEGLDLLNQAFAEASVQGLHVLAAKIAGGTSRIIWLNRRVGELERHLMTAALEISKEKARAAAPAAESVPANDTTSEAPPG